MSSRRGGFGEPYCSDDCYEFAGREIGAAVVRGIAGSCGLCQKEVTVTIGAATKLIPYRGKFLFICPACEHKGSKFVSRIHECCMCGAPLDGQAHSDTASTPDDSEREATALAAEVIAMLPALMKKAKLDQASSNVRGTLLLALAEKAIGEVARQRSASGAVELWAKEKILQMAEEWEKEYRRKRREEEASAWVRLILSPRFILLTEILPLGVSTAIILTIAALADGLGWLLLVSAGAALTAALTTVAMLRARIVHGNRLVGSGDVASSVATAVFFGAIAHTLVYVAMPIPLRIWYKLDDSYGDVAKNASGAWRADSLGGKVNGGTWNTKGKFGGALEFDGRGTYLVTGRAHEPDVSTSNSLSDDFRDGNITIALWVSPRCGGIVESEPRKPPLNPMYARANNHDGMIVIDGFIVIMDSGEVRASAMRNDGPWVSIGSVTNGEWHHIAVRYNAENKAFEGFVDGVKSPNKPPSEHIYGVTCGLPIDLTFGGAPSDSLGRRLSYLGLMDDIRVYNRALSDEQINNLARKN